MSRGALSHDRGLVPEQGVGAPITANEIFIAAGDMPVAQLR